MSAIKYAQSGTCLLVVIAALWSISALAESRHCPKPATVAIQQSEPTVEKPDNLRPQVVCQVTASANRDKKIGALPIAPTQARFFTINSVLAERLGRRDLGSLTNVAGNHAMGHPTDTTAAATVSFPVTQGATDEPFGLFPFRAPEGPLWEKWRGVEVDIVAEAPILAQCRSKPDQCSSPAAARFLAIVAVAREHDGRVKLAMVNRSVNLAIQYRSDTAQWGVPDRWSAPLDINNKGSFDTGLGDCEDYAIAKYVALREAGVAAEDLRIVVLYETLTGEDHAILVARNDGHWLILDNNHMALLEEQTLLHGIPLFSIDHRGVRLLVAPYVRGDFTS
jgi:predicted transglutaminase-like cysteine proteinase